jgi:Protein of unknown function DUF262
VNRWGCTVPDALELNEDELDLAEASVPISPAGGEGEEDVVPRLSATNAQVSATDWTIETIVTQMRKGRIDLNPKFQRRAAWVDAIKGRFIESAVLAYPIPQIVLAERLDRRGHFFVIDGKQRLLALRQFYAGERREEDAEFDPLSLSGLTVLPELKGLDIRALETQRSELFDAFENHTIRTVVVRNWGSIDFLFTLFLRLNTGSVPLSPQELRQALVPGDFVDFVDEASGDSVGLRKLLGNKGPDRRMVDAEILVRYFGLRNSLVPYKGNLKDFLDQVCRYYNAHWETSEVALRLRLSDMEAGIEAAQYIFGEFGACRTWAGTRWERSFNRAIFDVQLGCLGDRNIAEAAMENATEIRTAFQRLCVDDPGFARSVSTTTKSLDAFRTRFTLWYNEVQDITGLPLHPPNCLYLD